MRPSTIVVIVALMASCLVVGCGGDRSEGPPNVIVIVMDAARADHFSCYGYKRPTSPRIDAFAEQATLYNNAIASSPWTIPSHASIFTGMDSFQHGARRFKIDPKMRMSSRSKGIERNALHERHATLAEVLRGEGYATAAVIANDAYLDPRWKLNRGFDMYDLEWAYSDSVNDRVFKWLEDAAEEPFFLFVNYMDTHKPYNTDPRLGLLPKPPSTNEDLPDLLHKRIMMSTAPIPRRLPQQVINQYDTGTSNVDDAIGALFDRLAEEEMFDNSVIVVTSDHGDAFGEHRLVNHGNDVYQPEVWIPLIIRGPGQVDPQRVDQVVSTSDIARLIFEHLPQQIASKYEDAFPNTPGNHPVISENYWSLTRLIPGIVSPERFDRVRTAVYEWPYKYVHSSDGESELYHLEDDPQELNNLIEEEGERAGLMAATLEHYQELRGRSEDIVDKSPLTEKEMKKLKALGYVGN